MSGCTHKESEKKKIQDMLLGTHEFIVNNRKQIIHIKNVGIAAEGCGAFWSSPVSGEVHIIDIGSGTVNLATIHNKRVINNSSQTLNFGIETVERGLESTLLCACYRTPYCLNQMSLQLLTHRL